MKNIKLSDIVSEEISLRSIVNFYLEQDKFTDLGRDGDVRYFERNFDEFRMEYCEFKKLAKYTLIEYRPGLVGDSTFDSEIENDGMLGSEVSVLNKFKNLSKSENNIYIGNDIKIYTDENLIGALGIEY